MTAANDSEATSTRRRSRSVPALTALAATVTSPVPDSACTWNGASSAAVIPRTLRRPSSDSASSW